MFKPPAHRLRTRPAAAKVAETFLPKRCALPHAIGSIDDDRSRRHATVDRGRINKWLDRRAGLALRLCSAVEAGNARVKTALHRQHAPIDRVLHDHPAADFRNGAKLIGPTTHRRDRNHIPRFQCRRCNVQNTGVAIGKAYLRTATAFADSNRNAPVAVTDPDIGTGQARLPFAIVHRNGGNRFAPCPTAVIAQQAIA